MFVLLRKITVLSLSYTAGFSTIDSINATANSTVVVTCKSNCSPINLIHEKSPGDFNSERTLNTSSFYVQQDKLSYIVNASVKLDINYNDTWFVCRGFGGTPLVAQQSNHARVLLQSKHIILTHH